MAVQVDRQAALFLSYRRQHDLIDQLADDIRRACLRVLIGQRFAQRGNLVAVVVRHVGMDKNRVFGSVLEPRHDLGLVVFKVRHLVLHAAGRHPVHERLHQPVQLALDLRERGLVHPVLRVAFTAQPVHVPRVFLAEFVAQRRVHEATLQALQHRRFERIASDGVAVVAGPFVAGVRAANALGVQDDKSAPTAAAAHQAGEKIMRAAPIPIAALLLAGA